MNCSLVWFKRDLRLADHAALAHAAQAGTVFCVYIVEPSLWRQPDVALQHYRFIGESLDELSAALNAMGGHLHVMVGEVVDVLSKLKAKLDFQAIFAHEETGNGHTYARDRAVARWCAAHAVLWHESPQFGVVRGLNHRKHWQAHWENHMAQATNALGEIRFVHQPQWDDGMPEPLTLGLQGEEPPARQRGGRTRGLAVLRGFLADRSAQYRGGISSPLRAPTACSRLSPYLSYGCLSMREVVQATRARLQELPSKESFQHRGLSAFLSRLYWHCHFIQKLESEPDIEWFNMHRGYDGLREQQFNASHFEALKQGRTGWPMVDACVAMLNHTGWLNFRMRAMLVSVAAYERLVTRKPVVHGVRLLISCG